MFSYSECKKELGTFCRRFREEKLNMSMSEMVNKLNLKDQYKNVWAWEHGQSTNLFYLSLYYNSTDDEELRTYFMREVFNILWMM